MKLSRNLEEDALKKLCQIPRAKSPHTIVTYLAGSTWLNLLSLTNALFMLR